jgi:hypothetical protein
MYSKSSLMEPDWEIDSIPMAMKAAKHVSLSPRTSFLSFMEEEVMLRFYQHWKFVANVKF